ncbi:hypothetical protein SAMN05892877_1062 [Rhizobium subbaraonis]|uniref:Uncharacterized protein n=1 Tax=Rhizobium subbaraonis TaxID=908946 RepID=A0A285UC09_9HYPH|nr:hypothetical protein [Rhizobium subbaraonis]SOC39455.1 hypothetical protein SAMN05892877_1062 [Rhizobium subbaraonis]
MRDWFPLTNYEFYAFVASGMLLVATFDYCFAEAVLVHRTEWTTVQFIFWTVVSFIVGHICAAPSAGLVEHLLARTLFHDPMSVQLGLKPLRRRERALGWLFAYREYAPLTPATRETILTAIATDAIGRCTHRAFEIAYPVARQVEDTARRLESFQNAYGFCRNIVFVSLIAGGALAYRYTVYGIGQDVWFSLTAFVIAIGMYGRFLKYYALFGREVLLRFHASLIGEKGSV